MMKKILLASVVVLVAAGGVGGWYVLSHRDPLQEAKASLSKGDYRSAALQLRTAVRDEPNNGEAHAMLAQLQMATDDPIAAEKEIKRAIELSWDKASALAVLSQAYMREKKWPEIIAEIPDHGASDGQTAYYLMTRAVAQHGLGNKADAGKTLAQAEQLAPQNAELRLQAARFAIDDGQNDKAMAEVDRALALDPQRADSLQLKASLLTVKGDREAALAQISQAMQVAPSRDDLLLQRAGLLLMTNQDAKAVADIDVLMSRNPPSPVALYLKVVLLTRQKKFTDADALLARIDGVLPQLPRGLYFKAMVKSETGQMAQAENAITAYVARFGTDQDAIRLMAAIELESRYPDRAIPLLVKAVEAGQRDADTLDLLGRAYAMAGKQSEAQRTFQQASETSQTPQQMTRLASARLQVGDLSGAASDLQRAVDAAPTQPGAAEALITTSIRLGQFDRAQEAIDKLRQQAGETEAVGNLTGLLHLARLEPDAAVAAFQDTARRFPDALAPRLNEARVLLQLNRGNDALPALKQILDKNPTQPEALTLTVQTLLSQGKGDEAIELAERAHKAKPDDLGLVNGEAQLLGRMKQFDKAIALIDTTKVGGKVPEALLAILGSLQLAAGNQDAAKQTYADLVAAEPNSPAAVLSDVDLLVRTKDYDGSRRILDSGLLRMPGNLSLLQTRVKIELVDKGLDAALQMADKLRSNTANLPAASTLKGGLLMGAQRYSDAAAAFTAEADRDPSSPALAVALAEAKQASGDSVGATSALTKFQAAHPDDPAVAQSLAGIEIAGRQFDAAERNLQVVLKQQPSNVAALNNMAWVYQQKGDKRAREYAQRAFEQTPTPEVADTLGWILTSQGDAGKGLPLLERAAAGAPQNPAIQYHLAVALKNVGRTDDAVHTLRPLIDSGANFDEKPQAASLLADLSKAKP